MFIFFYRQNLLVDTESEAALPMDNENNKIDLLMGTLLYAKFARG
jgi:hypothetical protein